MCCVFQNVATRREKGDSSNSGSANAIENVRRSDPEGPRHPRTAEESIPPERNTLSGTSLTSRSMKESQLREMLSEDVKHLVTVNEKFRAFIESGSASNRALPGLAAVAGMAGTITDACVSLWKEYKDADKKKVDTMVEVLEGYKWEDWDKI